jgi:hypothetical protein
MNRCIASLVLVTTLAGVAQAQDKLTGTWEGETRNGSSIALTLVVTGTALTGTLVRNEQSTTLSEGTVSKNSFAFKATLNGRAEGFSGALAGEEMKIWLDRQGASTAIVLQRAKGK